LVHCKQGGQLASALTPRPATTQYLAERKEFNEDLKENVECPVAGQRSYALPGVLDKEEKQ
jgi:hypothetical protein